MKSPDGNLLHVSASALSAPDRAARKGRAPGHDGTASAELELGDGRSTDNPAPKTGHGRLDIVIVNWNAGKFLDDCVDSIFASRSDGYEFGEIVVVDNASTDESSNRVKCRWGSRVRFISNSSNLGFARACNIGARRGSAEWLLFLNPDTRLLPDTLASAVRALDTRRNNAVGVCGIRLVGDNHKVARTCARFPDWRMFVIASLGLDRVFPRWCHSHVMSEWDHESSRYVDHVIGAFYLMQRSVFRQAGGFDERFFVYLEDLDLSHRIRALGFRTYYCAETRAYHLGGGTSRVILARRLFFALRSRLQYSRKHFSLSATVAVAVVTLAMEPIVRLSRAVLTARPKDAWNVIVAYGLLYASLVDARTTEAPKSPSSPQSPQPGSNE